MYFLSTAPQNRTCCATLGEHNQAEQMSKTTGSRQPGVFLPFQMHTNEKKLLQKEATKAKPILHITRERLRFLCSAPNYRGFPTSCTNLRHIRLEEKAFRIGAARDFYRALSNQEQTANKQAEDPSLNLPPFPPFLATPQGTPSPRTTAVSVSVCRQRERAACAHEPKLMDEQTNKTDATL